MKTLRNLAIAVALLALGAAAHAVTTNAGAQTVTRGQFSLFNDGSSTVTLYYTNTATGRSVTARQIRIPASQSSPIVDDAGVQLSATVPSALATAISSLATQLDSTISSAAAASKLDL